MHHQCCLKSGSIQKSRVCIHGQDWRWDVVSLETDAGQHHIHAKQPFVMHLRKLHWHCICLSNSAAQCVLDWRDKGQPISMAFLAFVLSFLGQRFLMVSVMYEIFDLINKRWPCSGHIWSLRRLSWVQNLPYLSAELWMKELHKCAAAVWRLLTAQEKNE